jgi:hypothetical protein
MMTVVLVCVGCSTIGAEGIRNSRRDFDAALSDAEAQQQLEHIVRVRFGETVSLLRISAITASWKVGMTPEMQFGFGPIDNYAGNITPLTVTGEYSENPTVSYVPIEGDAYARYLIRPIETGTLLGLLQSSAMPGSLMRIFVASFNDDTLGLIETDASKPAAERFNRVCELFDLLIPEGTVSIDGAGTDHPFLRFRRVPLRTVAVDELLGLLGQPPLTDEERARSVRVVGSRSSATSDEIAICARTYVAILRFLAATIDVPSELARSAGAIQIATARQGIVHIHCTKDRPDHASVAVAYRGHWFWIDDHDTASKHLFMLTDVIARVQRTNLGAAAPTTPVLTLPVSR